MNIDHDTIRDAVSALGFLISLFLLFIHIRNRRTQISAYHISRATFRSSSIELCFIASEQLKGEVLLKLIVFNPGSIAAIIQSFAVFEEVRTRNFLKRMVKPTEWKRIEGARWWPTKEVDQIQPRSYAEEYESLYVNEHRVILVRMPGMIDRREYLFEVKTNHGGQRRFTTIDATTSYFPYHFEQRYDEK